jgi:hypothetical protein
MDGLELLIGGLFLCYTVLLLAALVEWVRNRQTRYLSRWLWLPIIVVFSIVGPLAFQLLGREDGLLAVRGGNENGEG